MLVAGVDEQGVEYVLEDDPHALPMVDPRYDVDDKNWVRYRTSWGGFLRLVIFVLAIIWVVTTAGGRIYGWVDAQIEPGGEPGDPIELTIPSGASTNNVATLLENEGVISNATVFRYWLRCEGELSITGFLGCDAERTFQAGDYEIPTNLAFADAVAVLDQGPIPEIFVDFTIPEGLRLSELVERLLAVNSNFDRADLLDALRNPSLVSAYADPTVPTDLRLEGTLFPATYDVAEEDVADEARFLQRMADTFDQRYENLLGEVGRDPAILELGLSDYEVIVVASMIDARLVSMSTDPSWPGRSTTVSPRACRCRSTPPSTTPPASRSPKHSSRAISTPSRRGTPTPRPASRRRRSPLLVRRPCGQRWPRPKVR